MMTLEGLSTEQLHTLRSSLKHYTFELLGQESAGVGPDTHDSETSAELLSAIDTQLQIRGESLDD